MKGTELGSVLSKKLEEKKTIEKAPVFLLIPSCCDDQSPQRPFLQYFHELQSEAKLHAQASLGSLL